MKRIKIVTGTYGYRKDDKSAVELIDKKSQPIEVTDAEADRLIGLGVAEEVGNAEPNDSEGKMKIGHLDAKALESYSVPDLKALAKDLGLKAGGTKDELIERITKAQVKYSTNENLDEDNAEDADVDSSVNDEEPPTLTPADPE